MSSLEIKLATQIYSEREAWRFLQTYGPRIACSIRGLARLWRWHRSKVERFLKALKLERFIKTEIIRKETIITILANNDLRAVDTSFQQDKFETNFETIITENLSQDNFDCKDETPQALETKAYNQNDETYSRHNQDDLLVKEEKKKRSKKRKEEIKEKTLLKEGKKEKKISENNSKNIFSKDRSLPILANVSDESNEEEMQVLEEISSKLPALKNRPDSVTAEDVIDWAEKNLPATIDIEWELGKFKDYQRSKGKTTIKDSVSYFKNWLRRSAEFKQDKFKNKSIGGNYHEYYDTHNQNKQARTEFGRFFAGGVRALANLTGSGLVRQTNR